MNKPAPTHRDGRSLWSGCGSCSSAPSSCLNAAHSGHSYSHYPKITSNVEKSQSSRRLRSMPRRCFNVTPHGQAAGVFPPRNVLRGTTPIGGRCLLTDARSALSNPACRGVLPRRAGWFRRKINSRLHPPQVNVFLRFFFRFLARRGARLHEPHRIPVLSAESDLEIK